MITAARVVSYIFHPLLIPTLLFFLFSQIFPPGLDPIPPASHNVFIMLVFIVTFAMPLLNLGILKTLRAIRSLHMVNRSERILPFILISVIYVTITYMFYWQSRISPHDNFMKIMMVIDLLVIVSTLITFFYKISIHSVAAWGVIGILVPLNKMTEVNALFIPVIVAIILTGIIMSSRLLLRVHTLKEVMWGGIIGLATSLVGMIMLF